MDLEKDSGEMSNLAEDLAYGKMPAKHRMLLRSWHWKNGEKLDARCIVK